MGKKKVIKQTGEELIKETEKVETAIKKETAEKVAPAARRIIDGRIYIAATFNNTIISLTDNAGNVLAWTSAGKLGFKGSKKSTPYAASKVAEALMLAADKFGVGKIKVMIKGIGSGRDSALRSLAGHFDITAIKDVTPIPHGGCRPPKARRV